MEQQLPTYVGPLEPFEFTVSDQVQGQYLEALEDYHLRYVLSHQGISPVIHPGVLLSHSNATRSPSFGGPNTRWIHMREQTHFTASARLTDGVVALERIMWGFRSSAERPIPPGSRYVRPGSADSFPPSRTAKPSTLEPADWELPGKLKRPTAERIRLFSGWAAQNLHTDDQIAKAAGLPAPVASAAQGMGYLCEFMIDNLGEEWLTGGSWVLTFTKPIFPGDQVCAFGRLRNVEPTERGAQCTVDVHLVNQHGTTVTKGTATGHIQLA